MSKSQHAGKVILTELKKGDNNFIVVVRATERNRKGGIVLEVNEIRTLFPKESRGIVNWFNTNFDDFSQTENEVINFIQTKNKE